MYLWKEEQSMANRKEAYKRLGDYIELVNIRNSDLKVDYLVGLTINKKFIPSVANTIGTNMANYKVIEKNQFACSLMQVSRDGKIPIARFEEDTGIMSPAYPVFKVTNEIKLMPEYLMMWFERDEFDREAAYYAVGGVRGSLTWEDFCDMQLPVPPIEEQEKIVAEYQSIENKIKVNEQICEKLEATAQAIYKEWFVEFNFPDENGKPYKDTGGKMVWNEELEKEVPEGWEVLMIKDFCIEMRNGSTPSRSNLSYWNSEDIPWIKTGEVSNNVLFEAEEYISQLGFENSSTKLIPKDSVIMALYGVTAGQLAYLKFETTTNQACCAMICKKKNESAFLYYALLNQQIEIERMATGGAQQNLSKQLVEELKIVMPMEYKSVYFNYFDSIMELKSAKTLENLKLTQSKSLLLARMVK